MRIQVIFQYQNESEPAAISGVEDHVTDLLLPVANDFVSHKDFNGKPFTARVIQRVFAYDLGDGHDVEGEVRVTLVLDRVTLH